MFSAFLRRQNKQHKFQIDKLHTFLVWVFYIGFVCTPDMIEFFFFSGSLFSSSMEKIWDNKKSGENI